MEAKFSIDPVRTKEDIRDVVDLFEAYTLSLGIDLTFQDYKSELASLPGKYSAPQGQLLISRNTNGEAIGCAAMRPLATEGRCEMKRLYVAPGGRGLGLGKALVKEIVDFARKAGYREMVLDTLPTMIPAIGLYKSTGFESIEPYYETPMEGTLFLRLKL